MHGKDSLAYYFWLVRCACFLVLIGSELFQFSVRRRHWGQGIPPASAQNVHFCYACALTASGGEGLSPARGGAFPSGKLIEKGGRSRPLVRKDTTLIRSRLWQTVFAGCDRFTLFSPKREHINHTPCSDAFPAWERISSSPSSSCQAQEAAHSMNQSERSRDRMISHMAAKSSP